MTTMPNPFEFVPEQSRFVLNEAAFMEAILSEDEPETMSATDLLPIVEILTAHR